MFLTFELAVDKTSFLRRKNTQISNISDLNFQRQRKKKFQERLKLFWLNLNYLLEDLLLSFDHWWVFCLLTIFFSKNWKQKQVTLVTSKLKDINGKLINTKLQVRPIKRFPGKRRERSDLIATASLFMPLYNMYDAIIIPAVHFVFATPSKFQASGLFVHHQSMLLNRIIMKSNYVSLN